MSAVSSALAWHTSAESRCRAVLIPTGSVEQHGPHLPLGTDFLLARAVAEGVAEGREGVLVAEPVAYGCSWHHRGFRGTISVRPSTFVSVVVDVCRSVSDDGAMPILCNGHYGNKAVLDVAVAELATYGVRAAAFTYLDQLADVAREHITDWQTAAGHACAVETSLVWHLWPEAVRHEAIPAGGTPPTWPDPHLFAAKSVTVVRRFEELNPTGVIGRPELASAEIGATLYATAVERCGEIVDRLLAGTADGGLVGEAVPTQKARPK
jgi:creatinine amidohydrolase